LHYGSHSALLFDGFLRRLLWQPKCAAAARRRLALWAEIAAAPRDNRAPYQGSAPVAELALAPVSPMVALILARLAFDVEKIGD